MSTGALLATAGAAWRAERPCNLLSTGIVSSDDYLQFDWENEI